MRKYSKLNLNTFTPADSIYRLASSWPVG